MKNKPTLLRKKSIFYQAGFSLVEILVGLVIGLLATLVIMQVFSVFEGQKRTTTGSADAQTNGSIALYTITNELKSAAFAMLPFGYAGIEDSAIDCIAPVVSTAASAVGVSTTSPLSPVIITDGGTGAGASDSITIRYGDNGATGIPIEITFINGSNILVKNGASCPKPIAGQVGIAVVLPGTTGNGCGIVTVTDVPVPIVASNVPQTITLGSTAGLSNALIGGQQLVCLGNWREVTYRVNAGNLERNSSASVSDIVNIQAQYGIAATGLTSSSPDFNKVTAWVNAVDGVYADNWGPTMTTANRNRIKSVHIAVVARNGLKEKTAVTQPTCTTNKGTVNNGPCAWDDTGPITSAAPKIDLSSDATWQNYRYRVFETIVPLRNVMLSKETL